MNKASNEISDYVDLNLHEYTIQSKDFNVLSLKVDLFFQEVEIAIKMSPTDVYGHYNTFCLQNYVFSQFVSEGDVAEAVTQHINDNCYHAQFFDWKIEAKFVTETQRNSILLIRMTVNGAKPSERFMKTFRIES